MARQIPAATKHVVNLRLSKSGIAKANPICGLTITNAQSTPAMTLHPLLSAIAMNAAATKTGTDRFPTWKLCSIGTATNRTDAEPTMTDNSRLHSANRMQNRCPMQNSATTPAIIARKYKTHEKAPGITANGSIMMYSHGA